MIEFDLSAEGGHIGDCLLIAELFLFLMPSLSEKVQFSLVIKGFECFMHMCLGTFLSPTTFMGVISETNRLIVMFHVVFLKSIPLRACQTEHVPFSSEFGLGPRVLGEGRSVASLAAAGRAGAWSVTAT